MTNRGAVNYVNFYGWSGTILLGMWRKRRYRTGRKAANGMPQMRWERYRTNRARTNPAAFHKKAPIKNTRRQLSSVREAVVFCLRTWLHRNNFICMFACCSHIIQEQTFCFGGEQHWKKNCSVPSNSTSTFESFIWGAMVILRFGWFGHWRLKENGWKPTVWREKVRGCLPLTICLRLSRWWTTMLSDIERKVLRVIANYSAGRRRTPTIHELCTKTGRSRGGIMMVLEVLAKEKYIEWMRSAPDDINVLEAWERKRQAAAGTIVFEYECFR